jgi:hypothetical protein
VKLPLIKLEYSTSLWILSIILAVLCLVWRFILLPGWEYSTGVFLLSFTAILALFSTETSRNALQMTVMIFVVGTGILMMANRFEALMGGIEFGPGLFPLNEQCGVLTGLLWLLPVITSRQISERFTENLYLHSLYGALLVLAPSVFMLLSATNLQLLYWSDEGVSLKAIVVWFIAAYFFHFSSDVLNVKSENAIATRLYFVYLGYFFIAEIIRWISPSSGLFVNN